MIPSITRRKFIGTGTAIGVASAVGLTAAQARQVAGANDRVRLGIIGTGNRGTQVASAFQQHPDLEIVALCDVFEDHLKRAASGFGSGCDQYQDFRKLLDRSDIDAVLIATPDHWHALQTVMACRSGKDVYVEKPLSVTIHEGRRMVDVARETGRVVQVGTHRRSSPVWQRAIEVVRSGVLGKITMCQAYRLSNMFPAGIGKLEKSDPPQGLDWDMWLGPRAWRDYQDNIAPYKFRWWQDYSSQMGNWGVHYLDVMLWALEETAPESICAMGGKFAIDDDRTIPDTAQAMFQFGSGALALFGTYEGFGNPIMPAGEIELRGSNGTMFVDSGGVHVLPEHRGQFQPTDPAGKKIDILMDGANNDDTAAHTRNFLDCIKSREKPNADVEIGHRATSMALLANISLETRQRLEWNGEKETVQGSGNANSLLHYSYREPWKLD